MNNNTPPEAIILACWTPQDPLLGQFETDPALLPMGDKPMLQRVLEKLVGLGCRRIAVIHGDRPQRGESLLGDGERWGCQISHHYAGADHRPLRLLARLVPGDIPPCVLAAADTLPLGGLDLARPSVVCSEETGERQWTGWAVMSGAALRALAETVFDKHDLGRRMLAGLDQAPDQMLLTSTLSTASVAATLDSLPRLFNAPAGAEGITRRPYAEGVWIGSGSQIHPSARVHAPVYIGQNVLVSEQAEIGPNVTIGDNCIVDIGSHIEDSVLLPNTYVGQKLNVMRTLLAGNQLVNSRLGVAMRVSDPEFLCAIKSGEHAGRPRVALAQRTLAALLWLGLALPGFFWRLRSGAGASPGPDTIGIPCAVAGAYRSLKVRFTINHREVQTSAQGAWSCHFFTTFISGLADVISGKVALVGLQPRSALEIMALPDYWQRLYQTAPSGLVGEGLLCSAEDASPEMLYAGDALCAGPMPMSRVFGLLWRYATRVVKEAWTQHPQAAGTSGKTASQPAP
jgi:hypothetical protein